jgi:hypothetical protein
MGIKYLPTTRGSSDRERVIDVWAPHRFSVIARHDGAARTIPERPDAPAAAAPGAGARRPRRRQAVAHGGLARQATDARRPSSPRHRAQWPGSAYGLLMNYELALTEAVAATIALGLRSARADAAARERVVAAWRDPLTMVAAEFLADRLADQALQGRSTVSLAALKRALRPYANLVAVAAQAEMALA